MLTRLGTGAANIILLNGRRRRQAISVAPPTQEDAGTAAVLSAGAAALQSQQQPQQQQLLPPQQQLPQKPHGDEPAAKRVRVEGDEDCVCPESKPEIEAAAENRMASRPHAATNRLCSPAVPIKSELSADGEEELTGLEKWYCHGRREQIWAGCPFFAQGVPPEEQMRDWPPRIDKYPKIKARLAGMVVVAGSRGAETEARMQKLFLLRKLQAWEQHGVGTGGYAAPLAETGGGMVPSDAVIELLDSSDEEGAAAGAVAGCAPIEIDNYADEHWDVLFVQQVKAEVPRASSAGGGAVAAVAAVQSDDDDDWL